MIEVLSLRFLSKKLLQWIFGNHCLYKTDTIDYGLTNQICSNLEIHICSNLVNCNCWENE